MVTKKVKEKKVISKKFTPPKNIKLELSNPSFNEYMRCGLGGLASALRALHIEKSPNIPWANGVQVTFKHGSATVYNTYIELVIDHTDFFTELFKLVFSKDSNYMIDIAGTYDKNNAPNVYVKNKIHTAYKNLFFGNKGTCGPILNSAQKCTFKEGVITDNNYFFTIKVYNYDYHHQRDSKINDIAKAFIRNKFNNIISSIVPGFEKCGMKSEFDFKSGFCLMFFIVGCIPYNKEVVVLSPKNLISFAEIRPKLRPSRNLAGSFVFDSKNEYIFLTESFIRKNHLQNDVQIAESIILDKPAWQQIPERVKVLSSHHISDDCIDQYVEACILFKDTLMRNVKTKECFFTSNSLKKFIVENTSQNNIWYTNISITKHTQNLNLTDKEGIIKMMEKFNSDQENQIVNNIQTVLKAKYDHAYHEHDHEESKVKEALTRNLTRCKSSAMVYDFLSSLWKSNENLNPSKLDKEALIQINIAVQKDFRKVRDLISLAILTYKRPEKAGAAPATNTPTVSSISSPTKPSATQGSKSNFEVVQDFEEKDLVEEVYVCEMKESEEEVKDSEDSSESEEDDEED
jgi:hypothetical protein